MLGFVDLVTSKQSQIFWPRKLAFCIVTIVFLIGANSLASNDNKTIKIAAGSILEGYYFTGLKICKYITQSNNGINCDVVPTSGTLENLQLLKSGEVNFAFVQSNLALDAYQGKGYFDGHKPFHDILQLLRLHDEAFTIIVKDKDKFSEFDDLDGKKISNGPIGSDSAVIYEELISYYNFKQKPQDIELFHEAYAQEFCNSKIDAIIMMTGHPNALVNHITHQCESNFLSISKDKIDKLVKSNPAFKHYTINAKGYPGIDKSENTIAVPAILITTTSTSPTIIKNFLIHLKHRINQFKAADPLLNNLSNEHFTSGFILPGFDSSN